MTFLIIIGSIFLIWLIVANINSYNEGKRQMRESAWLKQIKEKYPEAYNEYFTWEARKRHGRDMKPIVMQWDEKRWEMENAMLLVKKNQKERSEREEKWAKEQHDFAEECVAIARKTMPGFGFYKYFPKISTITKDGKPTNMDMLVWQHFQGTLCLSDDLDYTNVQYIKNNFDILPRFKNKTSTFNKSVYDRIIAFIKELRKNDDILVYLNYNIKDWNADALTYHYNNIIDGIGTSNLVTSPTNLPVGNDSKHWEKHLKRKMVIIDMMTENDWIKWNCTHVFENLREKQPLIAYISLLKFYDRQEMTKIIKKANDEAERRIAEEREKEEERKRQEAEECAAQKRQEEERAKLKRDIQAVVTKNKKDWVCLYDDFYCTGFLNIRNQLDQFTLNDFRNGGAIDFLKHERVLGTVIPQIKQRLIDTFGESDLKLLTLFCIPASTRTKNEERYEDFSIRLCKETGMENAYTHVHIKKSVFWGNDNKETTGRKPQPELEFDNLFYKGRNILLFDDVVTTGDTMLRYKDMMGKLGATVIAGICLGKPSHGISPSLSDSRLAEERAGLQSSAKSVLINNAKDWEHLYGDFYYTWLFYYYPTNIENFVASDKEWNDRRTVWNFKNDPDKNISPILHEVALDKVIPQIRQRLCETFGEEYLQFLTLVCLPASTNAKNEARYEEFASRICEETGMENGYEHTHVVKDGMSKNHPANQTNHSIQPVIEFDKDFFKGKYVLLFDDIVTKGGTMLRYKEIMKSIGATVVGGMCLGKTKHERPGEKAFPLSDMTEEEISQLLFGE